MHKKYDATIEEDIYQNYVIVLPDAMLNELGWVSDDDLEITTGSATGAITIVNVTHNRRKIADKGLI